MGRLRLTVHNDMQNTGKTIAFTVLITLLFFGLLESSTRLIFASNTMFNLNIGAFKAYHPTRRTQLKNGYQRGGILVNSHGLLGPEFSNPAPLGTLRILTIGDSVSFTPTQRNYSAVLETHLNTWFTHQPVEVLVGAVPGYSSYEALDWYDEFLHELNPDIALLALGWNDMGQYHPFGLKYKNAGLYQERDLLSHLMEMFYFIRIPYFILGYLERAKPVDTSPLHPEEKRVIKDFTPVHYEQNLTSLIKKLESRNCTVYLLTLAGLISFSPTEAELSLMHFPRNIGKK